ncbi:hypothetical protein IAR50_003544 [Cryptococcus sp. DSM 104548]
MRIVRLSRTSRPSTPRVSVHLPSIKQERATLPPPMVVLSTKCLLPPLLILTLVLTLIPLLLPTMEYHGTAFFTIQPTGDPQDAASAGSLPATSETSPLASASASAAVQDAVADVTAASTQDSTEIENDFVQAANLTLQQWLGLEGPSIFAGALQICSRVSPNESIECTSSSQAADHAALLPLSLGEALFALPTSPSTPILLLVSGILSLLATAVFISGLVTWRLPRIPFIARKRPLEASPHRPDYPGDTDSVRNLIREDPEDEKKELIKVKWGSGPHPAFFCLVLAACGVGGGATLEVRDVARAWRAWDNVQGAEVGLEFVVGPLTFLLPFLPLCHILVIVVGSAPILWTLLASQKLSARPGWPSLTTSEAQISTLTAASALQPSIVINEPEPRTTIIEIPHQSPAKVLDFSETPMVQQGGRSFRTSWRNTFGVRAVT